MLLANAINVLNDKGVKYVVSQENDVLVIKFGLMITGKKGKVEIIPEVTDITVRGIGVEKKLDEAGLVAFIDTVVELKAIQEQEAQLVEALQA